MPSENHENSDPASVNIQVLLENVEELAAMLNIEEVLEANAISITTLSPSTAAQSSTNSASSTPLVKPKINFLSRSAECLFNWSYLSSLHSFGEFLASRSETFEDLDSDDNGAKVRTLVEDMEILALKSGTVLLVNYLVERFTAIFQLVERLSAVKPTLTFDTSLCSHNNSNAAQSTRRQLSLDTVTELLLLRHRFIFLFSCQDLDYFHQNLSSSNALDSNPSKSSTSDANSPRSSGPLLYRKHCRLEQLITAVVASQDSAASLAKLVSLILHQLKPVHALLIQLKLPRGMSLMSTCPSGLEHSLK